jgi:hypothetical protein
MEFDIEQHVKYALLNAKVKQWPFSHFYAENVFPTAYYEEIQHHLTSLQVGDFLETTNSGTGQYRNRAFSRENVLRGCEFMESADFMRSVLKIFQPEVAAAFPDGKMVLSRDIRLIRDSKEYKIGPHTDAKWKLVSLLFYLPPTGVYSEFGTSLFVPKDPKFVCEGGPHYPFEPFNKVFTAPFVPNACLGFWKTNKSFHGVEPIPIDIRRDVLLYNIYRAKLADS